MRVAIAGLIVVAHDPVGPGSGGESGLVLADELGDERGLPRREDEVEVEGHLRAEQLRPAVVLHQLGDGKVDLADKDALGTGKRVALEEGTHVADDEEGFGLVGVVVRRRVEPPESGLSGLSRN